MTTRHSDLRIRVSPEMTRRLTALAEAEGVTKTAILRRMTWSLLEDVTVEPSPVRVNSHAHANRSSRLSIRLIPDDHRLLKERAVARRLTLSTYMAALTRSHLRNQAPLPRRELTGLMQAVSELGSMSRNLNLIARGVNAGAPPSGPSRDDLMAALKVCEALRKHVRDLIAANLKAWETGYAETTRPR